MRFETSQFSSLTESDYGEAATSVDVRDYPGDMFRVYSDGTVKLLSTGKEWKPTVDVATYNLIIANLADYPGNEEKMALVLGTDKVSSAISRALPVSSGGGTISGGAVPAGESIQKPISQQWWFYPAVSLSVTGAITLGVYAYFTRTKKGKKQWAKMQVRSNPLAALAGVQAEDIY
jgi:branched-subunit amino acid ABC-type transport system permease component